MIALHSYQVTVCNAHLSAGRSVMRGFFQGKDVMVKFDIPSEPEDCVKVIS